MTPRRNLDRQTKQSEFEAVAVPFMAALYTAARRLTEVPEDAADLVQDTYLRAYRTFENFTPGTNCKAWLFTIMYSVYINDYHRRRRRGPELPIDDLERRFDQHIATPNEADDVAMTVPVGSVRVGPEVEAALRRLSPEFRAPVLLVDVEGLSYDEAAAVLGCPVGTVRSRLFRARRLLFAALQEYAVQTGFMRGDR